MAKVCMVISIFCLLNFINGRRGDLSFAKYSSTVTSWSDLAFWISGKLYVLLKEVYTTKSMG